MDESNMDSMDHDFVQMRKMPHEQKPKKWWQSITVEPTLFIMAAVAGFASPTYPNLLYTKVCIGLYSEEACDEFTGNESEALKPYRDELQRKTSQMQFYDYFCYTLPTFVMIFLLGSWSDRFSRKIPMIFGSTGAFLSYFTYAMLSINIASPVYICLIGTLCYGLCGGFEALILGSYSYLSDIIPEKDRTKRLSFLAAIQSIALVIPLLSAGILLEKTSFLFVFSFVSLLTGLATVYTIFFVKDLKPSERTQVMNVDPAELEAEVVHNARMPEDGHNVPTIDGIYNVPLP